MNGDRTMNDNRPYVIAEMAWGHNGSKSQARKIIDIAAESGASAISIHITDLATYMVPDYGITKESVSVVLDKESVFQYLNRINIHGDDLIEIVNYAKSLSLDIVLMPNDVASLNFSIKYLTPDALVLPASAFVDSKLVAKIEEIELPVFLRIGGATFEEIKSVVFQLKSKINRKIILLHGHQNYPTKIEDVRLNWLTELEIIEDVEIGLADHVSGNDPFAIVTGALALTLGINYIEKHLVVDFNENGEDFEAALDAATFPKFMELLRKTKIALGGSTSILTALPEDVLRYRKISRKKIVARRDIEAGEAFRSENIDFMRANEGIECSQEGLLLGRNSKSHYKRFEPILDLELN